jgi:Nucleolar protein,Nop52
MAFQLTLLSVLSLVVTFFLDVNDLTLFYCLLYLLEFTNNDFLRLWKGLYYCMWMSDKPLVQEELSEDLGSLVHSFPDVKIGIHFFRNFLETMCLEWFGIDQWRLDKFMMVSISLR